MAKERHLKSAPIKEAIIEFRVELPEHTSIKVLEQLSSKLNSDYPTRTELYKGSITFQVNKEGPFQTDHEHTIDGYQYTSSDGSEIVQVRLNGFTFSKIEPYHNWEELIQETKNLSAIYMNSLKPIKISRVSTRYINEIPIPWTTGKLEDYFTAPPQIPHNLTQEFTSFFTRIVSKDFETDATSIVVQACDSIVANSARVILDIDVFVEKDFSPENLQCWACLDELRKYKNKIFFNSITEKSAELFE